MRSVQSDITGSPSYPPQRHFSEFHFWQMRSVFICPRESPQQNKKWRFGFSDFAPKIFTERIPEVLQPEQRTAPCTKEAGLSLATTAPPYYEAFTMMNYNFGPAATSFLPASLPVNLAKFLMKRSAKSLAFTSQSAAFA